MALDLYKSASFVGLSLWLTPHDNDVFLRAVEDQSDKLSTVKFVPHVTLLPAIAEPQAACIEKCERLAAMLPALELEVVDVGMKDMFFQCVFALMNRTEPLLAANRAARDVFGRHDDPDFMPHLSIVYGDLAEEAKSAAIRELRPQLVGQKFMVDTVELWDTTGEAPSWKKVAAFRMSGGE